MTSVYGSRLFRHFTLFFLVVAVMPDVSDAVIAEEVISRMREKFADYKSFSADFERRIYLSILDEERRAKGQLITRRPLQFRLAVGEDVLVIADGQSIWVYMRATEQVIVSDYNRGEFKTPWEILGDYGDAYKPIAVEETEMEGSRCYLLLLKPRVETSQVSLVKIWIDRKKWFLLRLEEYRKNEDVTSYILRNHRINKKIADRQFQVLFPADVEIVDRRKEIRYNED